MRRKAARGSGSTNTTASPRASAQRANSVPIKPAPVTRVVMVSASAAFKPARMMPRETRARKWLPGHRKDAIHLKLRVWRGEVAMPECFVAKAAELKDGDRRVVGDGQK